MRTIKIECGSCKNGRVVTHFPLFETCTACEGSGLISVSDQYIKEQIDSIRKVIAVYEAEIKYLMKKLNE